MGPSSGRGRMTFVSFLCRGLAPSALPWKRNPASTPAPNVNGDHSVSREGVTAWRCTIRSNHSASAPPVM
jgi:hypothetical protein